LPGNRERRGFALPLVLTLLFVMFLIGSTVSSLSIDNAKMALRQQQQTLARQAAMAGVAHAQAALDETGVWNAGYSWNNQTFQPDASINAYYKLYIENATADTAIIDSTGTFQLPGSSQPAATVSERVYFQRADGPFMYPLVVTGTAQIQGTVVSTTANDIAIRVNSAIVTIDGSTVNGDIISTDPSQVSFVNGGGINGGTLLLSNVTANPQAPLIPQYILLNAGTLKDLSLP
jgi:hypothetical protein